MTIHSFLNHHLCVQWTTKLPSDAAPIKSPKFSVGGLECNLELMYLNRTQSYKLIIFKYETKTIKKYIYAFICFVDHPDINNRIFFNQPTVELNNVWDISKSDILGNRPNLIDINNFTITCLFHTKDLCFMKTDVSTQTTWTSAPVDLQSLSCNFSTFLKNESFSDVKLICATRKFSAHRIVLSARSEVFAAMFRNKMTETEEGVVDIKDMDPEVFDVLLQYMYLGVLPELCENTACCFYEAADRYAVHDLKRACSDWMVEYQTPQNCLDLLVLADKHSDEIFKETVVRFVAEHLTDISVEYWSTFRKRYPLLVLSVLERCMEDSLPGVAIKEK